MKAEHRKELQTNTLADNLGRLIQGGRRMNRRTVLIVFAVVVLGLGVWVWRIIQLNTMAATSQAFVDLDLGNLTDIQEKILSTGMENPTKAAEFQISWVLLWKQGIEPLAKQPFSALRYLDQARDRYTKLAGLVENDQVLSAEANYAIALIDETMLVTESTPAARSEGLTRVVQAYREVEGKYGDTAHGKQAKERADYLEKNRAATLTFYDQFANQLTRTDPNVVLFRILRQQKGGNMPPLDEPEMPTK